MDREGHNQYPFMCHTCSLFGFVTTPGSAKGEGLALCSGIIPGGSWRTISGAEGLMGLVVCKASN